MTHPKGTRRGLGGPNHVLPLGSEGQRLHVRPPSQRCGILQVAGSGRSAPCFGREAAVGASMVGDSTAHDYVYAHPMRALIIVERMCEHLQPYM
jgi:hypothetical protein